VSAERTWCQVYLAASARLTHRVRNPVAAWLDGMGVFNLRSHEKRVPERVFAQPNAQIAHFLRHLWATDGCVHLSIGKIKSIKIYYATSSARLAGDVQSLLLRLGINASVLRYEQKGRDQYHVKVSGKPEVERFIALIGSIDRKKIKHQELISACIANSVAKTNRDVIPSLVWESRVFPSLQGKGHSLAQARRLAVGASSGATVLKQNLSRERAQRIGELLACEELLHLATSDVYWDEIVSVEPDGEAPVYDLTVEGLHNFVANNMTAHNSIEQDADIVMFIYREELYDKETDKKGIAEIHIAKHRNGPLGIIPLRFEARTTRFQNLERYRAPEGY
jgi:replicative DNA helicase